MSTYIEQLAQIFNGAVWDGDLISKDDRDQLVKDGLVTRSCGYNIITQDGVQAFIVSGGTTLTEDISDRTTCLFAQIAVRRFDDDMMTGIFDREQFSDVSFDILGLSLDEQVVKLILSDRDWLSRVDSLRYQIVGIDDPHILYIGSNEANS
jgi:hypothetical protein